MPVRRSLTSLDGGGAAGTAALFSIARSAEYPSGKSWRAFAIVNADLTVDDHIANAIGILIGDFKRRAIHNGLWIEDGDVREVALPQFAALSQTDLLCRQTGHFVNR